MPKRTANDADLDDQWGLHKDEIISLYRKTSIEDVMKIMEEEHAFRKKKHEYEAHLRDWEAIKNVRKHEWDYIIPRYNERMKENKDTVVHVRGAEISHKRIKKEEKRPQRQLTIFERLRTQCDGIPRAKTPPGVVVRSPTPMSPQMHVGSTPLSITAPSFVMCSLPAFDFELSNTMELPWLRSINSPAFLEIRETKSFQSFAESGALQRLFNQLPAVHNSNSSSHHTHQSVEGYASTTPYLPSSRHDPLTYPHATNSNAIVTDFSYFEIFKTVFGVISNSQHEDETVWDLVELAIKQKRVFKILASLLRLQQPSTIAFAEKLLIPAIENQSVPLVSLILSSGVDLNSPFLESKDGFYTTPVRRAIDFGHQEIFELIYAKRQPTREKNCSKCPCENDSCDCRDCMSLIRYVIQHGDSSTLSTVLRPYKRDNILNLSPIVYNLRQAVIRRKFDHVHCLFDAFPETLRYAR